MTLSLESIFEGEHQWSFEGFPFPFTNSNSQYVAYARNGLHGYAKAALVRNPKRCVALVPSYSCGDELMSIVNAGYELSTYGVGVDCQLKSEQIKELLTSKVGLVVVTHYFGFPQREIQEISRICREAGVMLVEDCAHVLGTYLDGSPLGKFGDASIFSLRKHLPVFHGGILALNGLEVEVQRFLKCNNEAVEFELLVYLSQKRGFFRSGTPIAEIYSRLGEPLDNTHGPRMKKFGGYDLAMSSLAKKIISKTNVTNVINKRKERFNLYLSKFMGMNLVNNFFSLDKYTEEIVPMCYPLIVNDSTKVAKLLRDKGIEYVQEFWTYKHGLVVWDNYNDTKVLKNGTLAISLDREVSESELEIIADVVFSNLS